MDRYQSNISQIEQIVRAITSRDILECLDCSRHANSLKRSDALRFIQLMTSQKQTQPVAVGIDLGSFQSVIAVTQKGAPEVITNEANFRETPNIVGFSPNERFLGETGQLKYKTNYKDTVTYITRFLGLPANSALLTNEQKFITAATETSKGGRLAFRVNYRNESQIFLPEEVVAAFLNKLRGILELNKIAKDEPVVLSVPSYYNIYERKALLDAAGIAGMKVARLLNESSAVALDYGLGRRSEFQEKEPKNILFVDFGHSKLSLTVVAFTSNKISVVAQYHERSLGCRDIDYLVLEFYRQYLLKSTGGADLFENKKAVIKVMENIEKQRKILSANSEHGLNMEYLLDDNDLTYTMKREEFEKLAQPVFSKLFVILQKFKVDIDLANIKLASIELVGGGTRIPAFIRLVQTLFKMEPTRTINSSEAVAKGCAHMAAWKNPAFRPSDMTLEELNYNPVVARWNVGRSLTFAGNLSYINPRSFPESNRFELFPAGCTLPASKQLTIDNVSDSLDVYLAYDPPIHGFEPGIAFYQCNQVPNGSTAVLSVTLDENGLIRIVDSQARLPGASVSKLEASIHQHVNLADEHIKILAQAELKMVEQDNTTEKVYELKNKLETQIYTTKQKLKTEFKAYLGPGELEKFEGQLDEINNWVYNTDASTSHHTLLQKKEQIEKVLEPLANRVRAHQEFAKVIEEGRAEADKCTKWLQDNDRRYSHIPLRDRQAAMIEVDKLKQFINNAIHLQSKVPKWEPLITSNDEIREQVEAAKEAVESTMSRVPTSNPMRRSQYQEPTYARGEQWQQQPRQPQFQPQKPSTAWSGHQQQQDPFFGGFQQGPMGPRNPYQGNQSFNPRQSMAPPQQYYQEQPQEYDDRYYPQQQRNRRRQQPQPRRDGFNPFGGFFGGW